MNKKTMNRLISLVLCLVMVVSWLPLSLIRTAAAAAPGTITTVADPQTLTRPETIYGDNTMHAGKVTVGKSVSNTGVTVNGYSIALSGQNNFLITISQSAQVMGLASESSVPVDVVFVLDTSGSMEDNSRARTMVTAANSAISTLMSANEQNRVAVVAFSSATYGGGTSNNAAANVLSSLAHYTGDAATNHLQWVNSNGTASNSGSYVAGRDRTNLNGRTVNAFRNSISGGTNIQAGIIQGANILTSVTNTTYTDPATGETVSRIPFLIILSDGQPTFTHDDDTWYAPESTSEQGPGNGAYEGNGFIAAMTAAYYKGKITEHYYGANATGGNQCYVYTMGVELGELSGDELRLAQLTLNPKTYSAGDYAAEGAASYWNYGNTADSNNKNAAYGWKSYWNQYQAGLPFGVRVDGGNSGGTYVWTGDGEPQAYYELEEPEAPEVPEKPEEPVKPTEPSAFASNREWQRYYRALEQYEEDLEAYPGLLADYEKAVEEYPALQKKYEEDLKTYEAWETWVDENFSLVSGEHYTFTANSVAATKPYVTSIAYNDQYFDAGSVSDMEAQFQQMVTTIQQKALSAPTKVSSGDHDFDGYVTFTDPLGEYMEVKDMKGVVAGGYFFQGLSFAQKIQNFGTAAADPEFDALLLKVVQSRMHLTGSTVDVPGFIASAKASQNQAYYNGPNDYSNSIVWWGNIYDSGEEDQQVQVMGFADNDSIDYIEQQKAAGTIPAGADYVCRSYFFYGEAGGANPNPDHEYLYFMVRVQRELVAPYRQTVVISAPASLLSMEKVLVTESTDDNGNLVYSAAVEHAEPARVVYEVGLWNSINAENVSSMVSDSYATEAVNGGGSVNYDPATDTYHFFTNDWNRSESLTSHHRAMAKATFDAAADNEFYTYQEDTLVVDASGNPVTANPAGTTAYYVREYFAWNSDGGKDGTFTATKKTALIEVDIPAGTPLIQKDGKWYLGKGMYTSATLVVNGDDTEKTNNATGTSSVVAHPHRTGDATNSHYTVLLGNNGMLSLVADTYEPKKTASVNLPEGAAQIVDDEGKPVKIGDVLTYTVEVKNTLPTAADITVTDYVPLGTAFVAGSAGSGEAATGHTKDASIAPNSNNVLVWELKAVPAGATRYVSFQAVVTESVMSLAAVSGSLTNTAQYRINNGVSISSNTTTNPIYGKSATDVNNQPVTDSQGLKAGDVLVYHIRLHNNAVDAAGNFVTANVTVTDRVPAGTTFVSADNGGTYDAATGIVTWQFANMAANTSAVVSFRVQVNASAGEELTNTADITVGNQPAITTNPVVNQVDTGDMAISKVVAQGGDTSKTFTLNLTESTGLLNGTFTMLRGDAAESVTFTAGKASVTIRHGQTLTIKELPAGAIITVAEDVSSLPGWTPTYDTQSVTIVKGGAVSVSSVSVTNTYTLQPITVTVKGGKVLRGVNMTKEATFGFIAIPDSSNPVVGDPLTGEVVVQNTGSYSFALSAKTFLVPGTYRYTISEVDGGILGVSYDKTQHVLVLTITDNGDGTMSAAATLNGQAFDLNSEVSFTNTYTPEDTQLELTATKAMTGRQLTAGEFHFLLTDGTNSYKGINDANGNIVFETISFTAAGTYTYTMREVVPDTAAKGVTYDTKTYTVKVVVTDVDGQLTTAVSVDDKAVTVSGNTAATGVVFANSFEPDDVPLTLVAEKSLKTYTANGYVDGAAEAGKYRFQIVNKATGNVVSTGVNAADGTISFNTIYFSDELLEGAASKTFTFVISEVIPELAKDPNMLYDESKHEITVTLSQKADGTLTVAVGNDTDGNVDTGVTFTNYQNPASVSVTPAGRKTTNGQNLPQGLRFSFKVVPVDGSADAATGTSAATAGGSNSETVNVTFTSLVYTADSLEGASSKTFRYWIMESNAGAGNVTGSNGVTYDTTRYLYQVTLSRDSYNRLVATEKYFTLTSGGNVQDPAAYTTEVTEANVSFTNTYAAETRLNLTASKVLSGRALAAGEFDFVLNRLDATGKPVAGSEISGTNAAAAANTAATVTFATLNFSSGMLSDAYKHSDGAFYFSYLMSEIKPEDVAVPGVTYDTAKYVVTVKVSQTTDGLSAQLANVSLATYNAAAGTYAPGTAVSGFTAGGNTAVTFRNSYAATQGDVVTYRIRKNMVGRDARPGEFEFGLYQNGVLEDVATNDENGIITFHRTIPASAAAYAGTYKMVIKEFAGSSAGVSYSTQEYTIYVKITDTGSGKIEATVHLTEDGPALTEDANGVVDLTDTIVFTNTYKAHDTSFTPTAGKTLNGRDMVAGEFSFQAKLLSKNGSAVANGTVYNGVNNAQGQVIFEAIPYSTAGTFVYRISEVKGSHTGMTYDTAVTYLKVVVSDDGNGHLKAEGSYYSDEACQNAVNGAFFTNTYTPEDVVVQLEGTKQLTGRVLADKEFSFLVHEGSKEGKIVATGSNNANGKISFSTFEISAADMGGAASKTFTYVIVESDNNVPGVTSDKTEFTVTVTVTDDHQGSLTAKVNYPKAVVFKNTYAPNALELPLVAYKNLVGKDLKAGEFTFELKAGDDVVQTVRNDANGIIAFESLKFTKAGTYVYTLSEKTGTDSRFDYDQTVYTITVTVTDDGKGNLTASAAYSTDAGKVELLQFTNTYTPAAISVELEGTKIITDGSGKALDHDPEGFRFEVRDVDGNLVTTATSDSQGNIKFTGFRFTSAGEYRFLISEMATNRVGYTVDPTVWCVHFIIGYDAANGVLTDAGEYIHVAPESHDEVMAASSAELTFTNVYKPASVALTVKYGKELTGRQLRDHEFAFQMVDDATGLVASETRNHANGEVNFHLSFTEAGTYNYTVSEVIPENGKNPGVTYSTAKYSLRIEVVDDGSGQLKVSQTTGNGVLDTKQVFTNTYAAASAELNIQGRKELVGKQLTEGQFTFTITETDSAFAPLNGVEGKTVSNGEDGTIDFGTLTYTKTGTYYYTIRETVPADPAGGITYDPTVYHLTVTVVDNGNGQLVTSGKLETTTDDGKTEVDEILFTNRYTIEGGAAVELAGVKQLVGTELVDGAYTFELYATNETYATEGVVPVTTTNADGKFSFRLSYDETQVGQTFYYLISEKNGGQLIDGVLYSDASYRVKVEIKDNGVGGIVAEVTADGLTKTVNGTYTQVSGLLFRNEYKCADTQVVFTVKKTMTGDRTDPAGFTFGLYEDLEKDPVYTVTSDADGVVSFEALVATHDHISDTPYTFYIREILPVVDGKPVTVLDGVTYDSKVYVVKLTVTHDGKGNLVTSYTVDDAEVEEETWQFAFTNSYKKKPAGNPTTGDDMNIALWVGLLLFSAVAIAILPVVRKRIRK